MNMIQTNEQHPSAIDMFTAVQTAGRHIKQNFRQNNTVTLKDDGSPVTGVDLTINKELLAWSKQKNIGYIGEEGNGNTDSEYIMYVDPLDGTSSFTAGIPVVTIAVSLMKRVSSNNYSPVYSIICEPLTGYAWYNLGLDTTFVSSSDNLSNCVPTCTQRGEQALVTSMFGSGTFRHLDAARDELYARQPELKYRSCGSPALCGGLIASGTMQGLMMGGGSAAEVCAILPIIRGAKGVAVDLYGTPLETFELSEHNGKIDFVLPDGAIFATDTDLAAELVGIVSAINSKQ